MCGLDVGELIFNGGDCHIYKNHFSQVEELLSREAKELPILSISKNAQEILNKIKKSDESVLSEIESEFYEFITASDFKLHNYNPHPTIKAEMAV